MNVDLVFEGGGVLGINYVGVLKALEEKGYVPYRCAGTSAGSFIAALVAAGYTSEELYDFITKTDFSTLIRKATIGRASFIGKSISLIRNKGVFQSEIIEQVCGMLLEKKGVTTFKNLMTMGRSRLKIVTADITSRKMLILPDDLGKYGLNPYEFSVAKAVRMSCSIPLFFTPVEILNGHHMSYVVDGGLLSNYPIWIFDVEGVPKWPTFGFKIKDKDSCTYDGKNGIVSFVKDVVAAPINQNQEDLIRNKDMVRTVIIDNDDNISSTDFKNMKKNAKKMYENGYKCSKSFLDSWDFDSYIEEFRK